MYGSVGKRWKLLTDDERTSLVFYGEPVQCYDPETKAWVSPKLASEHYTSEAMCNLQYRIDGDYYEFVKQRWQTHALMQCQTDYRALHNPVLWEINRWMNVHLTPPPSSWKLDHYYKRK